METEEPAVIQRHIAKYAIGLSRLAGSARQSILGLFS